MAEFFTLLTTAGRSKLAQVAATGIPLELTKMVVGDGGGAYYSPLESQTALKREVWRGNLNRLAVDPQNPSRVVAEGLLPDEVGGFYVREVGLLDKSGTLIALGKFPESYKPKLETGSNKQLYVRMVLEVSNVKDVILKLDGNLLMATQEYVDSALQRRDYKESVRVASTTEINLNGLQTVDGVVLQSGDRVLVKDQTIPARNGIYLAATGAWTRASDADNAAKLNSGAVVPVEAGTINADTLWILKTDGNISIGATPLSFQWVGGLNAPTQLAGDNSSKIANTAFVQTAVGALVDNAPTNLNTLKELAAALGNDANFASTVNSALALKAPLASPNLTGVPTTPTPVAVDNSSRIANTAFVKRALGSLSGANVYNGEATLDVSDIGKLVRFGYSGYTINLPAADALIPIGSVFYLMHTGLAGKINFQCQVSDRIAIGSGYLNNFALERGDAVVLVKSIEAEYTMLYGPQQYLAAPSFNNALISNFDSLKSRSGYQKLPSGIIEQWVAGGSDSDGVMQLTLPIVFPNKIFGGLACEQHSGGWATITGTLWGYDVSLSNASVVGARVRLIRGSEVKPVPGVAGMIRVWGY